MFLAVHFLVSRLNKLECEILEIISAGWVSSFIRKHFSFSLSVATQKCEYLQKLITHTLMNTVSEGEQAQNQWKPSNHVLCTFCAFVTEIRVMVICLRFG